MNSENKNFLLAVAISFVILILYPVYLKWVTPKSASVSSASNPKQEVINPSINSEISQAQTSEKASAKTYSFSNDYFNVEFTDRGAAISKLVFTQWEKKTKGKEAVLIDQEEIKETSFAVHLPGQGTDFEHQIFKLERLDSKAGEIVFYAEESGKWAVRKKYRFDSNQPVFWLEVEITNLSSVPQATATQLTVHLIVHHDANNQREAGSFVSLKDKLVSEKAYKIQKKPFLVEGEIVWQILARHFFALAIRPEASAALSKTTVEKGEILRGELQFSPQPVQPNEKMEQKFFIYAGPKYYRELKSFGHGFEQILSQGVFGIFKLGLLLALQWTYGLVHNYGWAIVLITFAIKLLFSPLTHMSFESMKKMQALQPKLKALQEQYKNDQAKLSKEMMELYKKHKVNPMSGCLPMLLQIPVFIAFYQVLAQTAEFQGEPFIGWIRDLSEPDRAWTLPFALPFIGDAVNILPLLMVGSMVWQQRLTPQAAGPPEQKQMMMLMPVFMGFIFYKLPSGLVLYWFVNNLLSIFHQLFVKGKALPYHEN